MAMPLNGTENAAGQNGNVPAFLSKLWRLVEDPKYDELISWNPSGLSFIIHNQNRFSKEVLPNFFKHNNMASFIRQLNMYGFRKMVNIDSGGLKGAKDDIEFYHSFFVREQESMLEYIKRKASSHTRTAPGGADGGGAGGSSGGDELRNQLVRELLTGVNQIQGKQEKVDSALVNMKRENEALWREVAFLRRKHREQQQIVEKLIRFLVTLVHQARGGPSDNNISMKRKHTLMIDEGGKFRKNYPGPVRSKTMPMDSGIVELDCDEGPIIKDVTNDPTSPLAVRSSSGSISIGSSLLQAVAAVRNSKKLQVNQGKIMSPSQVDMLVTSPAAGSPLCDATDEVCENLFDSEADLASAIADAPLANDRSLISTSASTSSPSTAVSSYATTSATALTESTPSPVSGDIIVSTLDDVLNSPFEEVEAISSNSSPPPSVLNTPMVEWPDSEPGPSRTPATSSDNGKCMEVALQTSQRGSNLPDGGGQLTAANTNGGLPRAAVLLSPAGGRGSSLGSLGTLGSRAGPGSGASGTTTGQQYTGPPAGRPRLLSEKYTDSLSEHCDGVWSELDWLQDQLVAGGLNIDSSTLLGLFSADDVLPNLESDDASLGGAGPGNNSQVVTYQTPSFLDLISPDDAVTESDVKPKLK